MATVGWIHSPLFLEHDTGPGHPERAERLRAVEEHLVEQGTLERLIRLQATQAPASAPTAVHDPEYTSRVQALVEAGASQVDCPDVPVCTASWSAALTAVGGALQAVDQVVSGRWDSAFLAARPPGHHAERDQAMGFCLFNNVALAARHAQKTHGLERVAIVDWDVHHGNGTQHLFEADPTVFYASLHQFPHYPGSGAREERGRGEGEGATLNCPQPAGSGDLEWLEAFEGQVLPALESFSPQLVLVSAGFDAHVRDPLSDTALSAEGYGRMTRDLLQVTRAQTGLGLVCLLEGGYDLVGLATSVQSHLEALLEA